MTQRLSDIKSVSVVVPLYNEEENVSALYGAIKPVLAGLGVDYEMVFVDDGSTDGTLGILEDLEAKDNRVVVLGMRRNFGQTAGLAAGFDHAAGDVIVTMDGG